MNDAAGLSDELADELILTASDALARCLRENYALNQQHAGRAVWRTPRIASLRQWTADTWADTWPVEQLISGTQALALWLEVIERDERKLLSSLACAREALRAERLVLSYGIDPRQLPAYSEEQQAWQRWRRIVRARMRRNRWLLREDIDSVALACLRDGRWPLPARIKLHGFDLQQPPATQALLSALRTRSTVENINPPPGTAEIERFLCTDADQQFQHIAALIRSRLQAGAASIPPRIVVVLADTEVRREELSAALVDLVAPWCRLAGDARGTPWRWERGQALTAQAWVEAAGAVFALNLENNPIDTVSRLLLSPVLWQELIQQTASLDADLRRLGRPRLRLETLLELAPTALRPRLTALIATLRNEPRRARPSDWVEHLSARLEALSWPGTAVLPSPVFQSVRELRRRLSRLGAMDGMLGPVDIGRARLWLGELLRNGFEPRVEHEQPITIGTPDEVLALPCDLLIIGDANANVFPGRSAPTPFLAIETQRAAGIPEAAPDSHLAHSRLLIAALCAQAAEVQILAPAVDARSAELLPSPLFGDDWQALPARKCSSITERLAAAPPTLFMPENDTVPPVTAAENVSGNAGLFTAWFESPFFAFCTHRLGLEPLPQPGHGLDPRIQGQILHTALERLWKTLRNSTALAALDTESLSARVWSALRAPLARHLPERDFGPVMVQLESARLHDLLRQWLRHESRRSDPFEVIACEEPLTTTLTGLPLSLRIDRLDRVDTAFGPRYLVLDYKTGREADPKGWREDRLRDPQLPLYATLSAQVQLLVPQIDGIGFAHLKDGHPALSSANNWCGSLIEPDTQPKRDWNEQLSAWSQRLDAAARGFLAGEAGVDPAFRSQSYYAWLLPLTGTDADPDETT